MVVRMVQCPPRIPERPLSVQPPRYCLEQCLLLIVVTAKIHLREKRKKGLYFLRFRSVFQCPLAGQNAGRAGRTGAGCPWGGRCSRLNRKENVCVLEKDMENNTDAFNDMFVFGSMFHFNSSNVLKDH